MSEGIVIALIGFAGAVFGAIIASATSILVASLIRKDDHSLNLSQLSTASCAVFVLLAAIGGAIGLAAGAFFGSELVQPAKPTTESQVILNNKVPTPVVQQSTQFLEQRDCNWDYNWKLQDDGNYLWVGLPVGTPSCGRVGQSGDALRNIQSGATFIVDLGSTPLSLAICTGDFSATIASQGTRCTQNIDLMPRVSGRLTVTGSTGTSGGFSVGN